jgi:hypothetical protein
LVAEGAATGQRSVQMAVGGAGTITIAAGTDVRLAAGCGGNLTIQNSSAATLVNNGTISAEATGRTLTFQNTTFTNNNITQVTTGTLNISPINWSNPSSITAASGTTLTFGGAGSNAGSITAASGTTVTFGNGAWSNAGTLSVTSATLNLGGTFSTSGFNFAGFTRTGGTVNLTGTLNNAANTLTLNAATGSWNLSGGTIDGGTVSQTAGSVLAMTSLGGTLNNVTLTGGDLLLNTASAQVMVSGSTRFPAARLQNSCTFQMASGFTLNDLLVAEGATAGQRTVQMAVGGAGTVTIAPGTVLRLAAGCGGNLTLQNSSAATLVNNGTISVEAAGRTLTFQNTAFTNNNITQVTAGTLTISATNWSNPGSITAASGTTLNFTDIWSNAGTLSINAATLNLGGTFSTSGFNFPGFTRTGGTVNLTGTLNNAASTLTLNAATGTWNLANGTINNGSVNQTGGSILAMTSSGGTLNNVTVTGSDLLFNTASAQVLVSGSTRFPAARLQNSCTFQMAAGYTLNDLLVAEGATAGQRTVQMAVGGTGTVTIAPGTEVRLAAGCGGNLTIQNSSTATLVNNGLITAEATGRTLTIQNTTFTNNAMTQISAGTLSISPTSWSNPGTITAGNGTTVSVSGAWSNAGTLGITSATLNLGGTFATAGFNFAGFTRTGGTVNLTGTLDNAASTLTLNAATGTWNFSGATINNGTVNQTGGSLLAMTTSGGTLANVAVTGADLLFDVDSAQVLVSGSTSFPAARLRSSSATLRMTPGYTLNSLVVAEGAATGQRAIALAVGGTGTVTVGPTGSIRLAAGCGGNLVVQNSSVATLVNNGVISAEAAGRTLTLQNSVFSHAAGTLNAAAGTLDITSGGFSNGGQITVGSGATMKIAGALINTSGHSISTAGKLLISGLLDIQSGSTAIAQPGGTALIRCNQFTLAGDNVLNLNDNDMIIDYNLGPSPIGAWNGTAYNGLTGLIQQAYDFSAWDGLGITTKTADAAGGLTTLAIGEAADVLFLSGNELGHFDGELVDATTVLIKYTYAGDANMDGLIDASDYGVIDNYFQFPGTTGVENGDFNFDGVIDAGDYGLIDNSFQLQGLPL